MHNNTYTVVGISTLNNAVKLRFANNLPQRIATLARNGHREVKLVQCDVPMRREGCVRYAMQHEQFVGDIIAQALFASFLAKYEPRAAAEEVEEAAAGEAAAEEAAED